MVFCQQSVKLDQISFIMFAHLFDAAHFPQIWKMQAGKTITIQFFEINVVAIFLSWLVQKYFIRKNIK